MKKFNLLIDGYNLRLPKGSGIKYYTISLIKVLDKFVNISLLFDYKLNFKNKHLILTDFYEKYIKGDFNFETNLKYNWLKVLFYINKGINFKIPSEFILGGSDIYLNDKNIIDIPYIFKFAEILDSSSKFVYNLNLKENIDIFHSTYMLSLNVKRAKRVTTIHDLIPLKLPHTTLDNKKYFFNKVKKAIKSSDKIITISEFSKKDILETFDVDPEKVVNCYQSFYFPKIYNDIKLKVNKFKLRPNEYFLFVGNIEPKKNVGRLIKAFMNLDKFCYKKLVIVGKKAWLWEDLLKGSEKYIKKKRIILLDYVSREDLIALYQNALAFVFPSLYEGFGLPPLEAMACRCPVITSNLTSLPEVCGDAAIYCDPYSVISIQMALEKVLNMSVEERDELIKKGLKRVEFFNEKDYRNRLLKVYESIL